MINIHYSKMPAKIELKLLNVINLQVKSAVLDASLSAKTEIKTGH